MAATTTSLSIHHIGRSVRYASVCRKSLDFIHITLLFIKYQDGSLIHFADARTIRIVRLMLIFFTAGQMQLVLGEYIPSNYWTSAFLQVRFISPNTGWTQSDESDIDWN